MTRADKNMLLLRAGLTIKRIALITPEEKKEDVFEALENLEEIIGALADEVEVRDEQTGN